MLSLLTVGFLQAKSSTHYLSNYTSKHGLHSSAQLFPLLHIKICYSVIIVSSMIDVRHLSNNFSFNNFIINEIKDKYQFLVFIWKLSSGIAIHTSLFFLFTGQKTFPLIL